MRTRPLLSLLAIASLGTTLAWASQPAQVRLLNSSIRINRGECDCGMGLTFHLYFSSAFTEDPGEANGELAPWPQPAAYSHGSFMLLEDVSMFVSVTQIEMNLPLTGDSNGDGISDFFEPGQAVSASSQGIYQNEWGPGTLVAAWTRAKGATRGDCVIWMDDPILGDIGPFTHTFDLIECHGTLDYVVAPDKVTGNILLAGGTFASGTVQGSVVILRSGSDPHNALTLQAGAWSDGGTIFGFSETALTRSPAAPSVYRGALSSEAGDFRAWTMLIDDPNDSDGDGIPDLSDDSQPPRRPLLTLTLSGGELRLTVSGDAGRSCRLQEADSVAPPSWQTVRTITLTSEPQTVTLPYQAGLSRFWRAEL
jgi:hypothetical protein